MTLFATCEADSGQRHGRRHNVACGERAVVTVTDFRGRVALCALCAEWLSGVVPYVEQTPIGGAE